MATIQNASISYRETNLAGTGSVEISITYTLEVSPMEKLLSNYGFYFDEYISLFEVNEEMDVLRENNPEDENDEYLFWFPSHSIPASEITNAPGNLVHRTRREIIERHRLRGSDNSPNTERIRARVTVGISSLDAAEIKAPGTIFTNNYFSIDPFPTNF